MIYVFLCESGDKMKLTNRLASVASLIDECDTLVDIGTDHAYIPIFCVENDLCKKAIACDINQGPLDIAEKNIKNYGLSEKISTRLSNGFENYVKSEAQCIVIAGMGGLLINEIIKAGFEKISDDTVLILQPMIAVYEVREFLFDNGFCILDEKLAKEENKIYNIIKCKKGNDKYSEYEKYVGKKLIENKDPLLREHMNKKIYTINKVILGLKKTQNKDDELKKNEMILSYYEKARKGQF